MARAIHIIDHYVLAALEAKAKAKKTTLALLVESALAKEAGIDSHTGNASTTTPTPPPAPGQTPREVLESILNRNVSYLGRQISLRDLMRDKSESALAALMRQGIKPLERDQTPGFAFSTLYFRTPAIRKSLLQIPGAKPSSALPPQRFGTPRNSRAIWVPASGLTPSH